MNNKEKNNDTGIYISRDFIGYALANNFSESQILNHFNEIARTAHYATHDDKAWLDFPSIKNLVIHFCLPSMEEKRKGGHILEIVHFIETASQAVTHGGYLDLPKEVIAFVAFAHDLLENDSRLTARMLVDTCCQHLDKKYQDLAVRSINGLTDDPYLVKREKETTQPKRRIAAKKTRLNTQTCQANGDYSGLAPHVRWADKYATLKDDVLLLGTGNTPLGSIAEFRRYYEIRGIYLEQLNVPRNLKTRYRSLTETANAMLAQKEKGFYEVPPSPWSGFFSTNNNITKASLFTLVA